jgi:hypothetical protein
VDQKSRALIMLFRTARIMILSAQDARGPEDDDV